MMTLEQLLQAGVHAADLETVDSHFSAIGVADLTGMLHLKSALVALANVADFESTVRPSYIDHPEPSEVIKPIRKHLEFSKYLRNKFVGHIHPELIAKALEWQPMLRHVAGSLKDPSAILAVNLWLLETTINSYVMTDGKHKLFDSETDLMFPPDWKRFVDFLEFTIRGAITYLRLINDIWTPKLVPVGSGTFDLGLSLKAGKAEFKFLAK